MTPVRVHLTSTIQQDGQSERFDFAEKGTFVELNGKYYLRYIEHQGNQATPVQFRLDDQVHLHRAGDVQTQLNFDPMAPTDTRYRTDYGIIRLMVKTARLDKKIDPAIPAGRMIVEYTLSNKEQIVGTYYLQLQFTV